MPLAVRARWSLLYVTFICCLGFVLFIVCFFLVAHVCAVFCCVVCFVPQMTLEKFNKLSVTLMNVGLRDPEVVMGLIDMIIDKAQMEAHFSRCVLSRGTNLRQGRDNAGVVYFKACQSRPRSCASTCRPVYDSCTSRRGAAVSVYSYQDSSGQDTRGRNVLLYCGSFFCFCRVEQARF